MATRPNRTTYPPEWANSAPTGRSVDPSTFRTAGWLFGQIIPSNGLNWLQNMVGRWIDYFDDDIQTGRTPATGYLYDGVLTQTHYLGPAPGWLNYASGVEWDVSGTPSYMRVTTNGVALWTSTAALDVPVNLDDPGTYASITDLTAVFKAEAMTTLTVKLKSVPADGSAGDTTDLDWDLEAIHGPTGGFDTVTATGDGLVGLPLAIDPDRIYWWEITIAATVAATDAGLAVLSFTTEKTRAE